ncbi:MAG: hypothetical protein AAB036_01005 [Elusimicrobiota bacterium]
MNRGILSATVLLAALVSGAEAKTTAEDACAGLKVQAGRVLADAKALTCRPRAGNLSVEAVSPSAFETLRKAIFPQGRFEDFPVVLSDVQASRGGSYESSAQFVETMYGPILKGVRPDFNFDQSADHNGLVVLVGNPPGSAPPGSKPPAGSHPPGSQPPGHSGPGGGNDAPPPSSAPPSRPTPLIVPSAPAPNYWNTVDWGTVPFWSDLPAGWETNTFDESTGRYVSRWYEYPRQFSHFRRYSTDSNSTYRRAGTDAVSMSLRSREINEVKQCYYQGVYERLSWNSFEGRWDNGRFSHYRVACKRSEQYGDAIVRNLYVRFEMQGQSLMPWERETVVGEFDGRRLFASVQNPSYQYSGPFANGDTVVFRAGSKLRTNPDENGVSVELIQDKSAGTLKLRVHDKWAGYYQGETLEVAFQFVYVTPGWFTSNENIDVRSFENGTQLPLPSGTAPGSAGADAVYEEILKTKPGCNKYDLKSWAFRRANNARKDNQSLISAGVAVGKRGLTRVEVCTN